MPPQMARLAAWVVFSALVPPRVAVPVSIEGRQIHVDGKPFFLKGVNWNPVPQGGKQGNGGVNFRGFVESDSDLMAAAGINAVRTYEPITDAKVLDILWEKGIHVMNTIYIQGDEDPRSVVDVVNAFKDHPAILMWVIGNEWNYNMLYSNMTFEKASSRVHHVAKLIKQLDRTHPVCTVYGMMPGPQQLRELSEIDVWGLTAYTGLTFGHIFDVWVSRSEKPMLIAEFGADAWNSITGKVDEAAQAKAALSLGSEIIQNSVEKGGVCIGGFIFELADEWWKDGKGIAASHDAGGVAPGGGPFPDNTFNEEYWGIIEIDGSPRQAYKAYASLDIPGGSYPDYVSKFTVADISHGFRMKACGANNDCVGLLGDCCPNKDGHFQSCCSNASKHIPRRPAAHEPSAEEDVARLVGAEEQDKPQSHRQDKAAGPPPAICPIEGPVPCCLTGDCGSCAGDQCCPSNDGSITCPSASKALAEGCDHPKIYDCTGKTGTTAPKTRPAPTTTTPKPSHKIYRTTDHWAGYVPKHATTERAVHHLPTTSTTEMQHTVHFEIHHSSDSDTAIATIHSPFLTPLRYSSDDPSGPTTTQMAINLHTTMHFTFEAQTPGSWVLGPQKVNCDDVCSDAGGCVEGGWPRNDNDFLNIANGLGYACFDLQVGGGKFNPSTQQGNCGWSWNGGEGEGGSASATRCAAEAPAFTRRFCPCRSVPKSSVAASSNREHEPDVVMEKFSIRQRALTEEEGDRHEESKQSHIFA